MPEQQTGGSSGGQDYGRPLSIEELSNRFAVHPASSIVERFAIKWGVSANIISFLGLGAGLLAALFYYYQDHRVFIFAGFTSMFLWHVFDGADGRVARATGTSSAFGRIIDGMCDHLVFGAVYIAIIFYMMNSGTPATIWYLAIAAGISHAVQAAGYEERRQKFQRRKKGMNRDDVSARLVEGSGKSSGLAKIYDAAQKLVAGGDSPLDARIEESRRSGASTASTENLIDRTAIIVRAWALLNANNRTVMIAVMALIGQPELYFWYELIVLNILLVALIIFEKIVEGRIAASARPEAQPVS